MPIVNKKSEGPKPSAAIDLRALRERANPKITQAELARRVGKDQAQISRYEDDAGTVPFETMLAILQALGVDAAVLLAKAAADDGNGVDAGEAHSGLTGDLDLLQEFAEAAPRQVADLPEGSPTVEQLLGLAAALRRKPNLAVGGPFDAGKTTLINNLLGGKYLPTSYQPATKVPTYVRHVVDRPAWVKEEVWMLGDGFNPMLWDERRHCEDHRLVAGGLETLRDYGTHEGRHANESLARYALVFLDAPLLRACNIIDLPGYDNDTEDTAKAEANPVAADVAIYADSYVGFLTGADLTRLGQTVRTLPVLEKDNPDMPMLGSLFVVATHAAPTAVSDEDLMDILDKACARTWRHLHDTVLSARATLVGRGIELADLRKRFFTFYAQAPARRQSLETDLTRLLKEHLPASWRRRADVEIGAFKAKAKSHLAGLLDAYRRMLEDLKRAEHDLQRVQEDEMSRKSRVADHKRRVEANLERYRREAAAAVSDHYQRIIDVDYIERVIREQFPNKKDAQDNAAAYLFEQLQHGVEQKTSELADRLTEDIRGFLGAYESAALSMEADRWPVTVPFNGEGAFIGGLVGVAGVGALAAWAASLGNLGAYIIAAKVVGLLSALGVGIPGGTAAVMSLLAGIGGPIVVAAGIVALFAIIGVALFGPSWQRSLAAKIAKQFAERDVLGRFCTALEGYWAQTQEAFSRGAEEVEKKWQEYVADLVALTSDRQAGRQRLADRLARVEAARDFFAGVPWRGAQ